jgi:hypothetical protein
VDRSPWLRFETTLDFEFFLAFFLVRSADRVWSTKTKVDGWANWALEELSSDRDRLGAADDIDVDRNFPCRTVARSQFSACM